MPVKVDDAEAQAQSRIAGLRLCLFTLRFMENWRRDIDDLECVLIMIAVIAILGEHMTRADVDEELKDLRQVYPSDRLPRCNVSSIAAATAINRETTRRKVNDLIAKGLLAKGPDGAISFAPGKLQEPSTLELIRKQLD